MVTVEKILDRVKELGVTEKLDLIQAITDLLKQDADSSLPYPLTDPAFRKDLLNQIKDIRSGKEQMINWEDTEFYKRGVSRGLTNQT